MMRFVYGFIAALLILLAVLQNLLWLVVLFAIGFSYFFGAIWLFPLAVLVDGYFNAYAEIPVFSLLTILWYVMSELLRLRLRIIE